MYLRGFTTTSVDASSPANGDVTYFFNDDDFNLGATMDYMRGSQDRGLLPPANYVRLPYSGSYSSMSQSQGPGVTRDNTDMSYASVYNSVFQLAYLPRGTERNGGSNFQTTARSLLRMIQMTTRGGHLHRWPSTA